jgi:hypothetical protein
LRVQGFSQSPVGRAFGAILISSKNPQQPRQTRTFQNPGGKSDNLAMR